MSYAAIPTPSNYGTKSLPGLKGLACCAGHRRVLGGLGDASSDQANYSGLLSAGVPANTAIQIIQLGATQAEIDSIINDPDSETAANNLAAQLSSSGQASTGLQYGATTSGLPIGTKLQYTATFHTGLTTWSLSGAVAAVNSWLAANYPQLHIVNSTGNSNLLTAPTMILTVQITSGNFQAGDIQAFLDEAVRETESGLLSSQIAIVSGSGGAGAADASVQSIGTWLGNNWYWFALAGVGVLGYSIVKRMV